MTPGHTKFSPDRCFGWITNALNSKDIFLPSQCNDIINTIKNVQANIAIDMFNWIDYFKNEIISSGIVGIQSSGQVSIFKNENQVFISSEPLEGIANVSNDTFKKKKFLKNEYNQTKISNFFSGEPISLGKIDLTSNKLNSFKKYLDEGLISSI